MDILQYLIFSIICYIGNTQFITDCKLFVQISSSFQYIKNGNKIMAICCLIVIQRIFEVFHKIKKIQFSENFIQEVNNFQFI